MAWKAECIWMGPVGGGIMPYIGPPDVVGACPRGCDWDGGGRDVG